MSIWESIDYPITKGGELGLVVGSLQGAPPKVSGGQATIQMQRPGTGIPIELILQRDLTHFSDLKYPDNYGDQLLSNKFSCSSFGSEWELDELPGEIDPRFWSPGTIVSGADPIWMRTFEDIVIYPLAPVLAYEIEVDATVLSYSGSLGVTVSITFNNGRTVSKTLSGFPYNTLEGFTLVDFSEQIYNEKTAAGATAIANIKFSEWRNGGSTLFPTSVYTWEGPWGTSTSYGQPEIRLESLYLNSYEADL